MAAVQSTAEAARQANINKSEKVSWTTIENDQVEAALQAEASSLRDELGERKHQVKIAYTAAIDAVEVILSDWRNTGGTGRTENLTKFSTLPRVYTNSNSISY